MNKELITVNKKIEKLLDKKAQIDKDLEPLIMRKEELTNQEFVVICRQNDITQRWIVSFEKYLQRIQIIYLIMKPCS